MTVQELIEEMQGKGYKVSCSGTNTSIYHIARQMAEMGDKNCSLLSTKSGQQVWHEVIMFRNNRSLFVCGMNKDGEQIIEKHSIKL